MKRRLCLVLLLSSRLCAADSLETCRLGPEDLRPIPACLSLHEAASPGKALADGQISRKVVRMLHYDKRGLASIMWREGYMYVNRQGRGRATIIFDNGPDCFAEGLARTPQNGKIGFFDRSLRIVIPATHDFAFPFDKGHALVCDGCVSQAEDGGEHHRMVGGRWGKIDRRGRYQALADGQNPWKQ